jgi:hypothetical protein
MHSARRSRREDHLQGASRTAAGPRGEAARRRSGNGPGHAALSSTVREGVDADTREKGRATVTGEGAAMVRRASHAVASSAIRHWLGMRSRARPGAAVPAGWPCRRERGVADLRGEVEGRPPSAPGRWRSRCLAGVEPPPCRESGGGAAAMCSVGLGLTRSCGRGVQGEINVIIGP